MRAWLKNKKPVWKENISLVGGLDLDLVNL